MEKIFSLVPDFLMAQCDTVSLPEIIPAAFHTAGQFPLFPRKFFLAFSAKTGESPKGLPPVLSIPRQKFVKYRYKSKVHTTISYSPMPPDEKYRCKSKGENTPRSVTMPEMRCGGVMSNAG